MLPEEAQDEKAPGGGNDAPGAVSSESAPADARPEAEPPAAGSAGGGPYDVPVAAEAPAEVPAEARAQVPDDGAHADASPFDIADEGSVPAPAPELTSATMVESIEAPASDLTSATKIERAKEPAPVARPPGASWLLSSLAAIPLGILEELNVPRVRVRQALAVTARHMRRRPAASAGTMGALAGALFILYAVAPGSRGGLGVARGIGAWTVFLAAFAFVAVGLPLILTRFWPGVVAAVAAAAAWASLAFPEGTHWLVMATLALLLAFYVAATTVGPMAVAACLGYLAWREGLVAGVVVFATATSALFVLRRRTTGPVIAALWVAFSGGLAAFAARGALYGSFPDEWLTGFLPGPPGVAYWVLGVSAGAAALALPSVRAAVDGEPSPDRAAS